MLTRNWVFLGCLVPALADDFASTPACDASKSNVCDDFCNYRCSFRSSSESGLPQNITLWRLTPPNVTGLRNKNTGDARGDISYFLEKVARTQACRENPTEIGCFNEFGTSLYGQFTVEVDGQYGPYQECNPVGVGGSERSPVFKDSRDFVCGEMCLYPTQERGCYVPSYYKRNGTSHYSQGGVSCWCDSSKRELKTVGREKKSDASSSSSRSFSWRSLGGYWFTTPMISECPRGSPLGTQGCTWRIVDTIYKNASCVNGKIDDAVEKYGSACFDGCSKPLNRTGDCYLGCYKEVLTGNGTITKIPDEQLIAPWTEAFAKEDCPAVQPAPCSGKQCEPHRVTETSLIV